MSDFHKEEKAPEKPAPIGTRLREIRAKRGLTLQQVADDTGFALSFLSLLERDKVSINVDNLEKLARYYNIRMVRLFQGEEASPVHVTRSCDSIGKMPPDSERPIFALLSDRKHGKLEPLLISIPGGGGDPNFRTFEADIFVHVLEGSIKVESETGDSTDLSKGDSGYYFGFPGRRIRNPDTASRALILVISSPPTYQRDDVLDERTGLLLQSED